MGVVEVCCPYFYDEPFAVTCWFLVSERMPYPAIPPAPPIPLSTTSVEIDWAKPSTPAAGEPKPLPSSRLPQSLHPVSAEKSSAEVFAIVDALPPARVSPQAPLQSSNQWRIVQPIGLAQLLEPAYSTKTTFNPTHSRFAFSPVVPNRLTTTNLAISSSSRLSPFLATARSAASLLPQLPAKSHVSSPQPLVVQFGEPFSGKLSQRNDQTLRQPFVPPAKTTPVFPPRAADVMRQKFGTTEQELINGLGQAIAVTGLTDIGIPAVQYRSPVAGPARSLRSSANPQQSALAQPSELRDTGLVSPNGSKPTGLSLVPVLVLQPLPPSPLRPLTIAESTPPAQPPTSAPTSTPAPPSPSSSPTSPPPSGPGTPRIIELKADRQEYDQFRQIFTAEGNVSMRFQGALLESDRLQVNLANRIAVAEGNVALKRGDQILFGQRLEYNFVQGIGTIDKARGEINIASTSSGFNQPLANDVIAGGIPSQPLSDRLTANQPLQNVTSPGGISTGGTIGITPGQILPSIRTGEGVSVPGALRKGGTIRRLRFEADKLDFTPEQSVAFNVQITNDPFSPPELVLKTDQATFTRTSPTQSVIVATRPRLVIDQSTTIPLLVNRQVIDQNQRQTGLVQFGYDGRDRDGLFVQRAFKLLDSPSVQFSVAPQFLIQRAFSGNNIFESNSGGNTTSTKSSFANNLGLLARLNVNLSETTQISGFASFSSLDPSQIPDNVRAAIVARQAIGEDTLALSASYRTRVFNGSLGFQTVQRSYGILYYSPVIQLGTSGITLAYQASIQNILADTDQLDLLPTNRENNLTDLTRYQGAVRLGYSLNLWQGTALPATRNEGLRFSREPIVPYIQLGFGMTGVASGYSNGASQENLFGTISLSTQFGHFSRSFFDYTAISISYSQALFSGESPFLFDRAVDNQVLSVGFFQQIYGPFRFGVQATFNLDTNQNINTDYYLEYSRRTFGLTVRYNPTLQLGALNLRISDFNWQGIGQPFDVEAVTPVVQGVERLRNGYMQ